jgi:hypothetical protein
MEDVDTQDLNEYDEEAMFLCDVCGDSHELLFLDSYLRDTFRGRRWHDGGGAVAGGGSGELLGGESTI